jgi:hypothetical protein
MKKQGERTQILDHFEFDCFVEVVVNFHNNSELEEMFGMKSKHVK